MSIRAATDISSSERRVIDAQTITTSIQMRMCGPEGSLCCAWAPFLAGGSSLLWDYWPVLYRFLMKNRSVSSVTFIQRRIQRFSIDNFPRFTPTRNSPICMMLDSRRNSLMSWRSSERMAPTILDLHIRHLWVIFLMAVSGWTVNNILLEYRKTFTNWNTRNWNVVIKLFTLQTY